MSETISRRLTFLLTDIEKSTRLWERNPASMSRAVARHERLLTVAVERHGGRVVKSRGEGDSVFAVFGDALAAVRASVEGQLALVAEKWQTPHPLDVRMALHTGEAQVREGDFYGSAVIRCARLRAIAHGGQVVLSRATADEVHHRLPVGVCLRDLGTHRLRDLLEPERVFQACHDQLRSDFPELGAAPVAAVPPLPTGFEPGEARPFVGRERELEQLRRRWEEACRGNPQLVSVSGEPGIGKTRLVQELARQLHDRGAIVVYGRCEEEELVPYQPFVEALHHLVSHSQVKTLRVLPGTVTGELTRLVPALRERVPELPEPLAGDPEGERYRLFEAVAALVCAQARERPVALILDDLHWAGRPTALLLRHVVRHSSMVPLLVVASYRRRDITADHPLTQALADLRQDREFEDVRLGGLDREGVAALVGAWNGNDGADPDVVRTLHERTEGHPFFLVQLLRHPGEAGPGAVPESVKDMIRGRLGALPEHVHDTLSMASVIGATFTWELLVQVAGLSADVLETSLDMALAIGLIDEELATFGRYRFSHALVRQTLYDDLSATRRARLHRQVGEALEALYGPDQREALGMLAWHFFAAGQLGSPSKALAYSVSAGQRAAEDRAFEQAAGHYERTLQLLELAGASRRERCQVLLELGDARWSAGEFERSKEEFARAAEVAEDLNAPEELARAALGYGGQYPSFEPGIVDVTLVSLLERALAALGEGAPGLRARVVARLGTALAFTSQRQRAEALMQEAIDTARRTGDKVVLGDVLVAAHFTTWGPDNLEERWAMTRELVQLGREVGDRRLEFEGHGWGVSDLLEMGDRAAAESENEAHARLAEALRQPYPRWGAAVHRAMFALLDGQWSEAQRLAQEALTIGGEAENRNALILFALQTFQLRREQGGVEGVAAELAHFAEQLPGLPAWRCALALMNVELGRQEEARRLLSDLAAQRFGALPRDLTWLTGIGWLSEVAAHLADSERAAVLYELLEPYANRCLVDAPGGVCSGSISRLLGLLATTTARFDQAERHFQRALEVNAALRAPALVAKTRCDLAAMLLQRAQPGDRQRALDLLATVWSLAGELDMTSLLERVVRLGAGTCGDVGVP